MKPTHKIGLALSLFLFFSCTKPERLNIAIIHTNDVHGKIKNFDKLAYLKDSLLNIYDTVLLISAGDMFSGNPYVDHHEEKGFPIVDLMNRAGYDLATLGNHEFDYGQQFLIERIEQAQFPILCGNINIGSSNFKAFNPTSTISYRDVTLEFKSLLETANNGYPSTNPINMDGVTFIAPIEKAKELLVRQNHNAILIALTHLGIETDSLLATMYPDVDIIIGGHSHTFIEDKKMVNNVMIAQAGENLNYAGIINLEIENGKLIHRNYKVVHLEKIMGVDSSITPIIDAYSENDCLNESIAKLTTSLQDRRAMGCLTTDAQRVLLDLDFTFQNYWGMRVDSLSEGPISRKDVFTFDPFNNEVIIYNMTPSEIKSLLEPTVERDGTVDLFISGGTYEASFKGYDHTPIIKIFDNTGAELKEGVTYKVGLNSYIASSYKYNCADTGKPTQTYTANNLIKYLEKVKEIDYADCNRIRIKTP